MTLLGRAAGGCRGGVCHLRRWAACLAVLASPAAMADAEDPAARLPEVDLVMLAAPAPAPATASGGLNWAAQAAGSQAAIRGLNLGLRWRPPAIAGRELAAQVWHRLSSTPEPVDTAYDDGPPLYGAQVEMQLSPAKRVSLRDIMGLKLDNNSRVSVRPRKGKVSVYYKVQF